MEVIINTVYANSFNTIYVINSNFLFAYILKYILLKCILLLYLINKKCLYIYIYIYIYNQIKAAVLLNNFVETVIINLQDSLININL